MRCIFCLEERPPSIEHIFPLAIGGMLTTERVCPSCNSTLGSRVDSALCDFLPIRQRRAELKLAGNAKAPPFPLEMLLGISSLGGQPDRRLETRYDPATGKLKHRLLHRAADVVLPDGQKIRQISIDASDAAHIPKIIQRERKRHKMPPLSETELAKQVDKALQNITTIERPAIRKDISISFAFLRHAMLKIAYELAFLWLGELYLEDPVGEQLRTAICSADVASTDAIASYVGDLKGCAPFQYWTPHPHHHLAYGTQLLDRQIIVSLRIFDIYAAVVTVTNQPLRYLQAPLDSKLRFLAIDSTTGRIWDTSFGDEQHRLAVAMTAARRTPPFPDPL